MCGCCDCWPNSVGLLGSTLAFTVQIASAVLPCKKRMDLCSETSVMSSKPTSINDLPKEILLKILSYFGPVDLCYNIAEVCEKWSDLSKDMVLWKTLSYKCDSSSDISVVTKVLTVAPALRSLIVDDRKDVAHILEFFFHIRDLRKLVLKYCWFGEDGIGLLAKIVDLYPDLEVLSLEGSSGLTSAGFDPIPRLKNLSELNLSGCQELSGNTVRLIADSCQHLKILSLGGVRQIDDSDVIHVIEKLGKQLTSLVLVGQYLTDAAYLHLNNCTRLQELAVYNCVKMTDRGLLEGIGSLHELTSLRLTLVRNLTAQVMSTFLHQPSMSSVVSLYLLQCASLDDEGLKGIATRCVHLKELVVSGRCKVTDAGISMVVSHCSQLRVLNLMGLLSITGEGWLALVPSHLPHLRLLCLESCYKVCDKHVEDLKAAVPELKVFK